VVGVVNRGLNYGPKARIVTVAVKVKSGFFSWFCLSLVVEEVISFLMFNINKIRIICKGFFPKKSGFLFD